MGEHLEKINDNKYLKFYSFDDIIIKYNVEMVGNFWEISNGIKTIEKGFETLINALQRTETLAIIYFIKRGVL